MNPHTGEIIAMASLPDFKLNNYKDLILIEGGASRKKISRYFKKNDSYIVLDFSQDTDEFKNHLIIKN